MGSTVAERPSLAGVGVTKPISSIPLFSQFFSIVQTECGINILQVSPQLSRGETHQIWKWSK